MRIYRIAQMTPQIPNEIGTTPIPSNHIRLYHYTRGNPEEIKRNGLQLSHARGSTYGEPNMVWASSVPPDASIKNIVEFSVPVNDTSMDLEKPKMGESPDEWMSGNHHVGFYRDIRPEEIIAIHEPWHEKYRWIIRNPDVIERIKNGELDDLTEAQAPDEFKAIQFVKNENL